MNRDTYSCTMLLRAWASDWPLVLLPPRWLWSTLCFLQRVCWKQAWRLCLSCSSCSFCTQMAISLLMFFSHFGLLSNPRWLQPSLQRGHAKQCVGLLTMPAAIFAPLFSKVGLLASCCLKVVTWKTRDHYGTTVQKVCVVTLKTMPWNMHSLNSLISNEKEDFQSPPDSKQVPRAAVSPLTAP